MNIDVNELAELLARTDTAEWRSRSYQEQARHLVEHQAEWLAAPRVDVLTYVNSEEDVLVDVYLDGVRHPASNEKWGFAWDTGRDPEDIADDQAAVDSSDLPAAARERANKLVGYERDAIDDGE